jgi:hypothetical protein
MVAAGGFAILKRDKHAPWHRPPVVWPDGRYDDDRSRYSCFINFDK